MADTEILIARLPGRTGLYLGFQVDGVWRSVARFSRGEKSAEEFVAWARKAGIRYEDGRNGVNEHEKSLDGEDDGSSGTTSPQGGGH